MEWFLVFLVPGLADAILGFWTGIAELILSLIGGVQ